MQITSQLLHKCAQNDRKSQSELYRLSFSLLLSIAFRYYKNKDDAMAMLNQCFYKVLTGLGSFLKKNEVSAYKPWMSRIMINTIIDEYRKEKKRNLIISPLENTSAEIMLNETDYNTIEDYIQAEDLQRMLNTLPDLQQKVFNLFVIDGYRHKEIAEMLTISVGNSKWNLSIARKELKRLVKEVALRTSIKSA
jgi:RNA polymerase sigma-70 factor (ECF subfamily)